jgi:hypothetical protein
VKQLILISGRMRSGKNTFANFLADELKNKKLTVEQDAFANGVKNGSRDDFRPLTNFINDHIEKIKAQIGALYSLDKILPQGMLGSVFGLLDILKTKDDNWFEEKTPITRFILQAYGTEIFRKRVDPDWWALQLKKRFLVSKPDVTLVTDVRFPNEIEVFNNVGDYKVITIRVERNVKTDPTIAAHDSETALDNWSSWDYIIDNNLSMNELRQSATLVVNDMLGLTETQALESSFLFCK